VTIAPERPTVSLEPPLTAEALIREARRRQRRRHAAIILVILLALGATALAWGGWGSTSSPGTGGTNAGGNPLVLPKQSQLRTEILAALFPTSAADFTKGEQLASVTNALTIQRQARCLTRAGFPSSMRVIMPGTGLADNVDFPDTPRIAAHGFNYGTQQVGGGALVTAADQKAPRFLQASAACLKAAVAVLSPLDTGSSATLSAAWNSKVLPSIDDGQTFKTALIGWSECMRRGGVHVKTIDDFFNYSSLQPLKDRQRLGELFGRCMSTPESVRVRLRMSARSSFLADHKNEVSNLYALFDRLVKN
jgi:hypothetical protein